MGIFLVECFPFKFCVKKLHTYTVGPQIRSFLQWHFVMTLMTCHRNLTCLGQLAYDKIGFIVCHSVQFHKPIDDMKRGLTVIYLHTY